MLEEREPREARLLVVVDSVEGAEDLDEVEAREREDLLEVVEGVRVEARWWCSGEAEFALDESSRRGWTSMVVPVARPGIVVGAWLHAVGAVVKLCVVAVVVIGMLLLVVVVS